jgi:predicted nicotinamide N-methyase
MLDGQLLRRVTRFMRQQTRVSRDHLTPELVVRVIDEQCPLWMARPDACPFDDPYWAFYWPGGQAISRFILDNPALFRDRTVLDLGCGCGASTIALLATGARRVVANDIDAGLWFCAVVRANLNLQSPSVPLSTICAQTAFARMMLACC